MNEESGLEVSLSPAVGVGAVGFPVKTGLARGAKPPLTAPTALVTNAVVAMDVSLSPAVGVGAFGSPVKTGDTRGALSAMALSWAAWSETRLVTPDCGIGRVGGKVAGFPGIEAQSDGGTTIHARSLRP
jgi:hypothetical protein